MTQVPARIRPIQLLVIVIALLTASPMALGAISGLAEEAKSLVGEETRYIVGFHALPKDARVGGEYEGARIVSLNEPLRFVAVLTTDVVGFQLRTALDTNVVYVEEAPMIQFITDSPWKEDTTPADPSAGDFEMLLTPNDPSYSSQYGPAQTRTTLAWDTTLGDMDAAVCVIDTGVRYTHQDLTGSRWLGGWDYVNNDNDPNDDNGHGTHVAGTAAATINNGIGVSGMGNVGLYGVKALNSAGSGTFDQIANAITWCADNTMTRTVLSLSLGASVGSTALANAVDYAHNTRGKVVVAAAGNDGPCSNCVGYPAKYANAIAVTCTTNTEALCSFSSTGPEAEIAAPGNNIISTWHTSNTAYNTISGTSMSTPHVSGILALYWSWDTTISNTALRARLTGTAQDLGAAGRDNNFGFGEVDSKCLFDNEAPCGGAPPPPPGCSGGPANNCFASATAGTGNPYQVTQSTTGSTTETSEPAPCGNMGGTVWFTYTPSVSGTMTVETVGSNYDTVVAAYTGSTLTGLTNVACNDDIVSGNLQSRITFTGTAGTTYRIQAGGYNGATGSLTLKVTAPSAPSCTGPANNCFSTATTVAAAGATISQSTSGGTLETNEPRPCGSIGGTVWFTWTPTTSGTTTVETVGSSFDTVVAAYTGSSLTALTNVACNDDIGGGNYQSRITFTATAGTTYRIQAGGYNGATGSLTLKVIAPAACTGQPNNCFNTATTITSKPSTWTQSTTGSTLETNEPRPCGSIGGTVWYTYTPSTTGTLVFDTIGSNFDTVLAVYTGSSVTSLTNVACNDDYSGLQSRVSFTGTAGVTYRIQAGGYNSATGTTLKLNVS